MKGCVICPHQCGADRTQGELGKCYSRVQPIVSSYTIHHGEEPVISGINGAGNIFFGNCNLNCVFCQNHEISQNRAVELQNEISCEQLAEIMLELQASGCHNIGLVSPTHFSAPIMRSIFIAVKRGLHLPIIYNSNGYDSVETLQLLDGIIDIYLPDLKYGLNEFGQSYSGAENYFDFGKIALKEMYRQLGNEWICRNGILLRGLIIRHLVLPNDLSASEEALTFIARELSPELHISLLSQYHPLHKANKYELLNRTLRESEYVRVIGIMEKLGLSFGWIQELSSSAHYLPHFNESREHPFD
jgi:putative pyruvate formate lyase activating enzyme